MRVILTVEAGPHEGREFAFEQHDTFIVGRAKEAHFQLPFKDKFISRFHFIVEVNPPQCCLVDMGSTNGTRVNGKRVERGLLADGDRIAAGKTVLRVTVEGAEAETSAVDDGPAHPEVETVPPGADVSATWLAGSTAAHHPGEATAAACPVCARPIPSGAGPGLCEACRTQAEGEGPKVGGYRVLRELGRGGMGVVALALREADGAPVALKTITPAFAGAPGLVGRFLREAEILRQLDHPNIVAFRELGEADGRLFVAMDYVAGTDAARLLLQHGPLPVARAVGMTCQLLQALDYAHAKRFIHRDIKPANLLVARVEGREVVRLADFGLARMYQASRLSGLSFNGQLGGTFGYMAPEQITHLRDARPPVDQYAAAATLYKLLTDHGVYDFPTRLERQISMILQDDPVPIVNRRPDVPPGLAAVIHRGLARDPAARFADVQEMRRALLPFLGGSTAR
ncbi:MAG TPA: FHA domain-containing serine/threonine-protein kinase [Isosphaeraceae bacterium]|jgi:serine/threonine-protein kinase|nr:FHA domain-containing serine/threonine-protein kinase [Isosphaeraceae bacterium]